MQPLLDSNRHANIFKYSLLSVIGVFVLSLFFRSPDGDEAMIAEHSYWLQEIGYVKSALCTGLGFGWEYAQYHYHKLFVVCGGLIIKIFGVHETALRCFSLFFSCLLLYCIYLYSNIEIAFNKNKLLFIYLLLFFQYQFFYFSFIFRPEMAVVSLGFASFYFLSIYLRSRKWNYIVFAGLLSGLSTLMHLNGTVFILSGSALLLIKKEYKNSALFLLIATAMSLLYFFNISDAQEFNVFLYQFTNDPNLSQSDFSITAKFSRIFNEHLRYFHSPKEIVLSSLFLFAFIPNFKHLYQKDSILVVYSIAVLVFLAAIAHDKTTKYSTLYIPFMVLIIAKTLTEFPSKNRMYKGVFIALTSMYFIVNSAVIAETVANNKNLAAMNRWYSTFMSKKNVNVLTREGFFFNEANNYNIISTLAFEYRWKRLHATEPAEKDFYKFATQCNVHYILIENNSTNSQILGIMKFNELKTNAVRYGYKVKKIDNNFVLLEDVNYD